MEGRVGEHAFLEIGGRDVVADGQREGAVEALQLRSGGAIEVQLNEAGVTRILAMAPGARLSEVMVTPSVRVTGSRSRNQAGVEPSGAWFSWSSSVS